MPDTATSARLLVSYILAKSSEPLTVRQLQDRIEQSTGHKPHRKVIQENVRGLVDDDKVEAVGYHVTTGRGPRPVLYSWAADN
jgi:hypothetical protein